MTDSLSAERRSANMRAIRSRDMSPEIAVRRMAHSLGYRYRLHRRDLPGRPDLVFSSKGIVLFVHGCFWHQHSEEACRIARMPKSNLNYWQSKLEGNVTRDALRQEELREMGWKVAVIWECETKDLDVLRDGIATLLQCSRP